VEWLTVTCNFLRHLLHLIFFCLGWICSFGFGLAVLSGFLLSGGIAWMGDTSYRGLFCMGWRITFFPFLY
jgi:hypothetical protein